MTSSANREASRIVYIGDHCVEFSFGGHAFLAKLLEAAGDYECVAVECGWESTPADSRLSGINYHRCRFPLDRLQGSPRFHRIHARWVQASLPLRQRQLRRVVDLQPGDMVLTIAHEFAWLPALEAAGAAGAASTVFVHDEWVQLYGYRYGSAESGAAVFRQALSKATRVMSVSEGMQRRLRDVYATDSEVFLPPRRRGVVRPAQAIRAEGRPFRFAYCGQLWRDYWQTLRVLAEVGLDRGWQLDIYTNAAGQRVAGGQYANVRVHDFLPEERLVQHLAEEADAVVVALDFSDAAEPTMATMFSSKMAEYTATGLPVVIMAPPRSQMARWGKSHCCFVVIDQLDRDYIAKEMGALADDPARCRMLGTAAADLGDVLFSPENAVGRLVGA